MLSVQVQDKVISDCLMIHLRAEFGIPSSSLRSGTFFSATSSPVYGGWWGGDILAAEVTYARIV